MARVDDLLRHVKQDIARIMTPLLFPSDAQSVVCPQCKNPEAALDNGISKCDRCGYWHDLAALGMADCPAMNAMLRCSKNEPLVEFSVDGRVRPARSAQGHTRWFWNGPAGTHPGYVSGGR